MRCKDLECDNLIRKAVKGRYLNRLEHVSHKREHSGSSPERPTNNDLKSINHYSKGSQPVLKRDMEEFIKRQRRKEDVYGKDRTSTERDRSKAV